MLWAIGAMDQLASGSKVSKQIIIKEKKFKLCNCKAVGSGIVFTSLDHNGVCARLLVVNKEK